MEICSCFTFIYCLFHIFNFVIPTKLMYLILNTFQKYNSYIFFDVLPTLTIVIKILVGI